MSNTEEDEGEDREQPMEQMESEPHQDGNGEEEEEEIPPPSASIPGHSKALMSSEIPKGATGGPCYTCTICQATFDKVSILNKHFKVHAGGGGASTSPSN